MPSVRGLPAERQRSGETVWKAGDGCGAADTGEPERRCGFETLLAGAGAPSLPTSPGGCEQGQEGEE